MTIEMAVNFTTFISDLLDRNEEQWSIDEQARMAQDALAALDSDDRSKALGAIHTQLIGNQHADAIYAMVAIEPPGQQEQTAAILDAVSAEALEHIKKLAGIDKDDALSTLMGNIALMNGLQFERWRDAIIKARLLRAAAFDKEIARRQAEIAHDDTEQQMEKEKPSTWPYRVEKGRICFLYYRSGMDGTSMESAPVCDFTAFIKQEITDEGGRKTFVLSGNAVRGGAFEIEMDAEEFGQDRKLKATLDAVSGARDPVRAGMGKHLSASIQLLTSSNIVCLDRYKRTGWLDNVFLIPGREPPSTLIELKRKPPYRIMPEADIALGLEALEVLLESMTPERSTIAAAVVFQAPLARLAGWLNERYALFISGRTGSLKTSFVQALMCIYGPLFIEDEMLVKWGDGATGNAMMGMATAANDMPFLIDNFKPGTGGGVRAFVSLIHNIVEGGEKDRLNRSSELRDTKPISCWPICTGEDVPDSDPASLARVLMLPVLWQRGEANVQLARAQELAPHLSSIGNAWLSWLENGDSREIIKESAAKFAQYRARWAAELGKIRDDSVNKLRVASNLATNQLTWEILCRHPVIGPLAQKYQDDHLRGLKDIVSIAMAEATAEALEASRYLAALKELLTTDQVVLQDMGGMPRGDQKEKIIGYKQAGQVFLLPKIARRAAEQLLGDNLNGISQAALHKQLDGLGLIMSRTKTSFLKVKKINGDPTRVLHLASAAFVESEEPDGKTDGERIADDIPF